jgi:hypothetical protein
MNPGYFVKINETEGAHNQVSIPLLDFIYFIILKEVCIDLAGCCE